MNISKIYNLNNNISFGYYDKTKYGDNNNIVNRNTTWLYRTDIVWSDLSKFLENYYKDNDRVFVYCFGCSDGSEPYTLSSALLSNTKSAEKFFPIFASDCDSEIIDIAKNGTYQINYDEKSNMQIQTRLKWNEYFESNGPREIRPSEKLKKTVNFSTKDALDGIKEMKKGPKVVMCRNFWPYLHFDERNEFLSRLEKKIDKNSLLIIGAYDKKVLKLDRILPMHGFKSVEYTQNDIGSAITEDNVWQRA